jgi:hypothetical protein
MFIRKIGYNEEGDFFIHAYTYLPTDDCPEWECMVTKKLEGGQEISTLDVELMLENLKKVMLRKMAQSLPDTDEVVIA